MDLYQLRYFLEVARTLNFSRAAEQLHVSPPAVSKSVALLERSVGKRLFTRTRRQVLLTLEGERLMAHAQRVFDMVETAKMELQGQGADPAMLKIGSREMITNYLLGPSLRRFGKKHPRTRFGLYELGPRELAEALKKDRVDFGFHYHADVPDPALEVRFLGKVTSHIYAVMPGMAFVAPRYFGADPAEPSLDGYPDQKRPREIQYEGEFLETHRRFVLDGIAAAVLPDFVIRKEWRAGLVRQLPGPPLGRQIYFIKRRGRPLPAAVDEFLAVMTRSIKRLAY
jgi:DNA-binding transcriptional LysR family regulator